LKRFKRNPRPLKHLFPFSERAVVKDQLEGLVVQMVDRGILFDEAVGEFEKRFIKRVLERTNGNQSKAAEVLGIHRNTLSRKIGEYKLDSNGHRRAAR
jgi:DNA-binding protein Fis